MEHELLEESSSRVWTDRLAAINRELESMDATDEFCKEYLMQGGGFCERVVGKRCVKHRGCRGPLPRGKMCAIEFGQRVVELRKQVCVSFLCFCLSVWLNIGLQAADVEAERGRLRREWDRLRSQERSPDLSAQVCFCLGAFAAAIELVT